MDQSVYIVTAMDQQTFSISPNRFDVSLLPMEDRTPGTSRFREAVSAFLQESFRGFGGRVNILVEDTRITVTWSPDPSSRTPLEVVVNKLRQGHRTEGMQLLEFLLSRKPDDVDVLFNLGMALSDAGKLAEAEAHLRRAIKLAPEFGNGLIALGVALSRQQKNDEAADVLASAVALEPENPWARRNLGVALLKVSRFSDAIEQFRLAVEIQPNDQPSWVALGDALRLTGRSKDAEQAYGKAIDLNSHNEFAEAARDGSRLLAKATFQGATANAPRPDAVEYCAAAIKHFSKLPKEEVQKITFEIATLGRDGLAVNNPDKKYRLKSLPGVDCGFDLGREYEIATRMSDRKE